MVKSTNCPIAYRLQHQIIRDKNVKQIEPTPPRALNENGSYNVQCQCPQTQSLTVSS